MRSVKSQVSYVRLIVIHVSSFLTIWRNFKSLEESRSTYWWCVCLLETFWMKFQSQLTHKREKVPLIWKCTYNLPPQPHLLIGQRPIFNQTLHQECETKAIIFLTILYHQQLFVYIWCFESVYKNIWCEYNLNIYSVLQYFPQRVISCMNNIIAYIISQILLKSILTLKRRYNSLRGG